MARRSILILFTVLLFTTVAFSSNVNNGILVDKSGQEFLPGKFVVKYKNTGKSKAINYSGLNSTIARYSVTKSENAFNKVRNNAIAQKLNLHNVFVMETSTSDDILKIVEELKKDPNVEYAEPVYINKLDATPNDALYGQQYHLPQVHAPEAWDLTYGSSDVIIGIVDSGVDWDHEDLKDIIWINEDEIPDNGIDDDNNGYVDDVRGWDFVTNVSGSGTSNAAPAEDGETPDNNPMDFDGHGTHVSGIAAGHTNNSIGIASVSSGARIMPLRCGWHANDGLGYVSSVFAAEAYVYAADNGATVTNQSSGNSGQLIVDGAYYAFLNGVLIVESAGNGNDVTPSVLGGQSWAISVASVNSNDQKASYSSFGEYVGVSAPGGDFSSGNNNGILSTVVEPSDFFGGSKYVQFQGTSMAAPVVASVAGLVRSYVPEISVIDLYERIIKSADNIDAANPAYTGLLGSGRVNAYRALTESYSAEPKFSVLSSIVNDNGDNDQLDPGETVELTLNIRNTWQSASNVTISLSAENEWPITIESGSVAVGAVGGILDTTTWNTSATFSISCAADAYPKSEKLTLTISGDGFTQEQDYYLSINPRVLFVSDFDAVNNEFLDFSSFFVDAFGANEISFDHVYHSLTTINADLLSNYDIVVWGCEWSFPTLDPADRSAISNFLDNGGSFFVSGQDVIWELANGSENNAADVTFLNNYLKVGFVSDDVELNSIQGVAADPISDKLDLDFFQTKRAVASQYPDAVEPLDGAISSFNYINGLSGAVRYQGDYRLVLFGFGGFESISDASIRNEVMRRVINYLDDIEVHHQRVRDREETSGNYDVSASFTLDSGEVDSVKLYWDTDGTFPYNRVEMTSGVDGKYTAQIPAQETGTTVSYLIYVKTTDGKYHVTEKYEFSIGTDSQKPSIELVGEPYWNTVNAFGTAPFEFNVKMDDNLGVDSATTKINYYIGDGAVQSTILSHVREDIFKGNFTFNEAAPLGSVVNFYFSVSDASVAQNSAISDTFSFMVDSVQILDTFENANERWDLGNKWGTTTFTSKYGNASITDSPDGDYLNNTDNPLTFKVPFNLSNYKFAEFSYWVKATMENNVDSMLVEASNDNGDNWTTISFFARSGFAWRNQISDISDFTGEGNENVWIRFRMKTDSANVFDGVYIDDPTIRVSTLVTGLADYVETVPLNFSLKQNYPNPFNPATTIEYSIAQPSRVTLTVFNTLGQKVAQLLQNDEQIAGKYRVNWLAKNETGVALSTGVYVYRLKAVTADGQVKSFTKKMLLIK
ncbi:MAG: S8 family peptidase [Calditrichae bacterium]|nr:S8 family peptidase [Calditrichia bacterium]